MRPILRSNSMALARCHLRMFASTSRSFITKDHTGRGPEEHVTNQNHRHNIQSDASNRGQQARAEDQTSNKGEEKNSVATGQSGTSTAKEEEAKSGRKDRGMGLQDERGGKGHTH